MRILFECWDISVWDYILWYQSTLWMLRYQCLRLYSLISRVLFECCDISVWDYILWYQSTFWMLRYQCLRLYSMISEYSLNVEISVFEIIFFDIRVLFECWDISVWDYILWYQSTFWMLRYQCLRLYSMISEYSLNVEISVFEIIFYDIRVLFECWDISVWDYILWYQSTFWMLRYQCLRLYSLISEYSLNVEISVFEIIFYDIRVLFECWDISVWDYILWYQSTLWMLRYQCLRLYSLISEYSLNVEISVSEIIFFDIRVLFECWDISVWDYILWYQSTLWMLRYQCFRYQELTEVKLANKADPDEVAHDEPPHLNLHCSLAFESQYNKAWIKHFFEFWGCKYYRKPVVWAL